MVKVTLIESPNTFNFNLRGADRGDLIFAHANFSGERRMSFVSEVGRVGCPASLMPHKAHCASFSSSKILLVDNVNWWTSITPYT